MQDFPTRKEISLEDWKEVLIGEMLLLSFLSKAFRLYPDKEWLQSLAVGNVFSETPLKDAHPSVELALFTLQGWSDRNENGISNEQFTQLKEDYVRMFIGLDEILAPPWESVYFNRDRMVFQEQTIQVRKWYRRFGLETQKLHKEPDDHIGLEMSFLSYLSGAALQALEENQQNRFEQLLDNQEQFLTEHLLNWGPHWCSLVKKNARTDFYQGLAVLTDGTLLTLADYYKVEMVEEQRC